MTKCVFKKYRPPEIVGTYRVIVSVLSGNDQFASNTTDFALLGPFQCSAVGTMLRNSNLKFDMEQLLNQPVPRFELNPAYSATVPGTGEGPWMRSPNLCSLRRRCHRSQVLRPGVREWNPCRHESGLGLYRAGGVNRRQYTAFQGVHWRLPIPGY